MKICNRCLFDENDFEIHINANGNCNFCEDFYSNYTSLVKKEKSVINLELDTLLRKIKKSENRYDCLVGISGGVDSAMVLVKAKELGLRPLAVHMDNCWNSELAQNNIYNLVEGLNVDLYTHVINWKEYNSLLLSFLKADVVDIELLYDNAMLGVNYRLARKFNIKYILGGTNFSTEGMRGPSNWSWYKYDARNIKSINKKFEKTKLKTFPLYSTLDLIVDEKLNKISWINFLDYFEYNKESSIKVLIDKFNFKPYPYKHYESVLTRFYQGYILPKKFNIDKRKLHLSNLILTKQITRQQALKILQTNPYPDPTLLDIDIEHFKSKLNWTSEDFEEYINRKPKSHNEYGSEINFRNFILKINKFLQIKKMNSGPIRH